MKAKKIGLAVCVALGIAGMANGAPIAWTSDVAATEGGYGQYLSPGLFDTNGAPLLADRLKPLMELILRREPSLLLEEPQTISMKRQSCRRPAPSAPPARIR